MGNRRPLDLLTLALVLLVGAAVTTLGVREAAAARSGPAPAAEPLWLRYLDAGMDADDALWSRWAETSREAYARGDFAEAAGAARVAVTTSRSFSESDPRRPVSEALLDRSLHALERSDRLSAH